MEIIQMADFSKNMKHKAKIFGMSVTNLYKCGIFFWAGAGIYSLINLIMNLRHAVNIALYDGIITGVAVVGLILNIILLKRKQKKE